MKTKDARSFSSETQEEIRRKAVQAVLEGKKHVEAARIFGVTRHHRRQMDEVVSNTKVELVSMPSRKADPGAVP